MLSLNPCREGTGEKRRENDAEGGFFETTGQVAYSVSRIKNTTLQKIFSQLRFFHVMALEQHVLWLGYLSSFFLNRFGRFISEIS